MLPTNRGKARLSCVKAPNYGCELSNQSFVYDSVKLELILGQEKTFFFFLVTLSASHRLLLIIDASYN